MSGAIDTANLPTEGMRGPAEERGEDVGEDGEGGPGGDAGGEGECIACGVDGLAERAEGKTKEGKRGEGERRERERIGDRELSAGVCAFADDEEGGKPGAQDGDHGGVNGSCSSLEMSGGR